MMASLLRWRLLAAGGWQARAAHAAQRLSSFPFAPKLAVLGALCAANVLGGACLYRAATGVGWAQSAYLVYGVLLRVPGWSIRASSHSVLGELVLNLIFLFGLFFFATLLGVISNEIRVSGS